MPVCSISAGLDYLGIGPEHSYLKESKRGEDYPITDDEAVDTFFLLMREEGILPAIESAYVVPQVQKMLKDTQKEESIIICLSGCGDKGIARLIRLKGAEIGEEDEVE